VSPNTSAEPALVSSRRPLLIAGLWGFAEATVFFIVPDVFTSRVVLTQAPARAYACCAAAVVGALIGGTLLFSLASLNPLAAEQLLRAFDFIPGISPPLIEAARTDVAIHGPAALFVSSASGIPYKVCSIQSALGGVSFPAFLVMSAFARALRFSAVTGIAAVARRLILHRFSFAVRLRIHLAVWALFYALYFWLMSA
jgi:membrane protein YqaA with SNARE-associated domain